MQSVGARATRRQGRTTGNGADPRSMQGKSHRKLVFRRLPYLGCGTCQPQLAKAQGPFFRELKHLLLPAPDQHRILRPLRAPHTPGAVAALLYTVACTPRTATRLLSLLVARSAVARASLYLCTFRHVLLNLLEPALAAYDTGRNGTCCSSSSFASLLFRVHVYWRALRASSAFGIVPYPA